MRLEDWQDWIEKQFLDTNPPPAQSAPAADEAEPKAQAAPVAPEAATSHPQNTGAATAAPPRTPASPTLAPVVAAPAGGRDDAGVEDVPIPEINRYFPFLRSAPAEPAVDAQSEISAAPHPEASTVVEDRPEAIEPAGETPEAAAPIADLSETHELSSDAATDEAVEKASEPEPPIRDDGDSMSSPAQGRRRQRPRTRATRSSSPPELAPPLTSDEFWRLAPRHVRTLIAMGQDDTVQNSYKRQFKESRLALIERILDPTLSLEETARLLNVCPTTVRRYTNKGLLRHQRTPGDQRRFKLSDVLSFMEAQNTPER